eukprot:scaffold1670_cov108-Isochrysis_galbana.AAC.8
MTLGVAALLPPAAPAARSAAMASRPYAPGRLESVVKHLRRAGLQTLAPSQLHSLPTRMARTARVGHRFPPTDKGIFFFLSIHPRPRD